MHNSLSHRISALPGYAGHVHIDSNFQLLENSTDRSPEVMAELCGVLIGYLKARATAVDPEPQFRSFIAIFCLLHVRQTGDIYWANFQEMKTFQI